MTEMRKGDGEAGMPPMDPRLHGPHGHAKAGGDVHIRDALEVVQDDRLAELGLERGKRRVQLEAEFAVREHIRSRLTGQIRDVAIVRPLGPARPLAREIVARVRRHPVHPGREAGRARERLGSAVEREERLLGGVLRIAGIAEVAQADPVHPPSVPVDELLEGMLVALDERRDEVLIRGCPSDLRSRGVRIRAVSSGQTAHRDGVPSTTSSEKPA